jgi:hypothetical protein
MCTPFFFCAHTMDFLINSHSSTAKCHGSPKQKTAFMRI